MQGKPAVQLEQLSPELVEQKGRAAARACVPVPADRVAQAPLTPMVLHDVGNKRKAAGSLHKAAAGKLAGGQEKARSAPGSPAKRGGGIGAGSPRKAAAAGLLVGAAGAPAVELNRSKLVQLLRAYGEYPQKYRRLIW